MVFPILTADRQQSYTGRLKHALNLRPTPRLPCDRQIRKIAEARVATFPTTAVSPKGTHP